MLCFVTNDHLLFTPKELSKAEFNFLEFMHVSIRLNPVLSSRSMIYSCFTYCGCLICISYFICWRRPSSHASVLLCCCRVTAALAIVLLLWPTITEQLHRTNNIHHNLETSCPTAKTGVLGGGAFLSLDSCLFWLVALMLADNARADFFGESEDVSSGSSQPELVKADA